MNIHLTTKQIDQILYAIGFCTISDEVLEESFDDKGMALLKAEQTLLRARDRGRPNFHPQPICKKCGKIEADHDIKYSCGTGTGAGREAELICPKPEEVVAAPWDR
jgi:hypothetical protein